MTDNAAVSNTTKIAVVRECALLHRSVERVADSYGVSVASAYRWMGNVAFVDRALEETSIDLLQVELKAAKAMLRWMGWGEHMRILQKRIGLGCDDKKIITECLRIARDMAKAQSRSLNPASSIAVETKYDFIRNNMRGVPVAVACNAFWVARSGYYAWLRRTSETRYSEGERMRVLIAQAATMLGDKASYRRISEHLRSAGVVCSRHRVKTLIR